MKIVNTLLIVGFSLAGHAALAGDADNGAKLFKKGCKSCHMIGEGAKNKSGPQLNDLIGRSAASVEGYRYSKAMKTAGSEGLIWTSETLDQFLEKPKGLVKKTKMSYRGLKKASDRQDLVAYLEQFAAGADTAGIAVDNSAEVELSPEILALTGDVAYGEYLSSECQTCHQSSGESATGVPPIVGWPTEDFKIALYAYKQKVRENNVMQMMAANLGDEEIASIASYFASLGE